MGTVVLIAFFLLIIYRQSRETIEAEKTAESMRIENSVLRGKLGLSLFDKVEA